MAEHCKNRKNTDIMEVLKNKTRKLDVHIFIFDQDSISSCIVRRVLV